MLKSAKKRLLYRLHVENHVHNQPVSTQTHGETPLVAQVPGCRMRTRLFKVEHTGQLNLYYMDEELIWPKRFKGTIVEHMGLQYEERCFPVNLLTLFS